MDDYYNSEQFEIDFEKWLEETGARRMIRENEQAIRERIASENN